MRRQTGNNLWRSEQRKMSCGYALLFLLLQWLFKLDLRLQGKICTLKYSALTLCSSPAAAV